MKMITTFTKTLLVYFIFLTGTMISAQTVTVSSNLNSGTGTLRQLIADAAPDDSIVIPENYTIVLSSEIAFSKNLKINGQGSIVQVTVPGVSNWRVFTVGTTASTATTVSMYNLNLQGGYLATAFGATVWVARNHTFTMKNCTVSKGKATYTGGIFCDNVIGTTMNIQDCTFSENESTTANGGACILKGIITVSNCTFSNNKATLNGAAIACYNGALISNCKFINNSSNGITGGAVINYSPTEPVNLEKCTFESNTHNTSVTGAAAFVIAGANASSTLTNCTFYKNYGQSAGAVYNAKGKLNLVNCTFSGNSTPAAYGGAFINLNHATAKTTMINNIFAYNYNYEGLMDVFVNSLGTVDGSNNLIGAINGSTTALQPVNFNYEPASILFANYKTTGDKMPILETNGTIKLASGSLAINAGIKNYGTPELVPQKDQLGILRPITPSLGAVEYVEQSSSVNDISEIQLKVYPNPAIGLLNFKGNYTIKHVEITDLSGKIVLSVSNPFASITLNGISSGMYLVHLYTTDGNVTRKISIN